MEQQNKEKELQLKNFKLKQRICPAAHSPKGAVDSFGPDEIVKHVDKNED